MIHLPDSCWSGKGSLLADMRRQQGAPVELDDLLGGSTALLQHLQS